MKINKGFAPILLILVIIVLAVGGGAYYIGTKNNSVQKNIEVEPNSFTFFICDNKTLTIEKNYEIHYYKQNEKYYAVSVVNNKIGNNLQETSRDNYINGYNQMQTFFNPITSQSCKDLEDNRRTNFVNECVKKGPPPANWHPIPGQAWYSGTQAQCESYWKDIGDGIIM